MRDVIVVFFIGMTVSLFGAPPRVIPPDLYDNYTLNGQVPVLDWYLDNSYPSDVPIVFKVDEVNGYIEQAWMRQSGYYGATDLYLYALLDKYGSYIQGKSVAIVGTVVPWYESIILAYGGKVTTIEYNKIISEDSRIKAMTVDEYWQNPSQFDVILSISSIEHDGLGRYGDPINPTGDLDTMKKMKVMLKEGGLLFLSVPIGQDCIYWNAHRRYGRLRLPMLFDGWELIDTAGFADSDFSVVEYNAHQPLFLLQPKQRNCYRPCPPPL